MPNPRQSLLLIILLATALRCYQLGGQSLWYDETVSAFLATKDPLSLIAHTARDIHPPLYYLQLHIWTRLSGDSEFALAFASVFWSVLLIPLIYRIALRLTNQKTAILSTLLTTLSPFQIWYAQEVRMYTLGTLLGLLTVYALIDMIKLWPSASQQGTWLQGLKVITKPCCLWVGAATAGLYTLYFFAFLLVAQNILVLLYLLTIKQAKLIKTVFITWTIAQTTVLLLYLPWLPLVYRQVTEPPVPPWQGFTPLWPMLRDSWSAVVLGQSVAPSQVWPVLILAALLYSLALWPRRDQTWGQSLLAGLTLLPVVEIFCLSYLIPLFHDRYLILYSPSFYILLALGLDSLRRLITIRHWAIGQLTYYSVLIIYNATSLYSLYQYWHQPQYAADDLRSGVEYIASRLRSGDIVLINAGYVYPAFRYYMERDLTGFKNLSGLTFTWQGRLTDYAPLTAGNAKGVVVLQTGTIDGPSNLGWGLPESDFYAMPWSQTEQALTRLAENHPYLWHLRLYDTVTDGKGQIRAWLDAHGILLDEYELQGPSYARVQKWRLKQNLAPTTSPQQALNHIYQNETQEAVIALQGIDSPMTVVIGDELPLALHWKWLKRQPAHSSEQASSVNYQYALGLLDKGGRHWTQYDRPVGEPHYPTSLWAEAETLVEVVHMPIPLGLPPGEYFLDLTLYHPDTLKPLTTLASSPQNKGVTKTQIRLGTVSLRRPQKWPQAQWPDLGQSKAVKFANHLNLVDHRALPDKIQAGQTINLRLLWQVADWPWIRPQEGHQVVVILRNEGDELILKQIQPPSQEQYPMSQWQPGEVLLSHIALLIPGYLSTGSYQVSLALQDQSGELLSWREGLFQSGQYYNLGYLAVVGRTANFTLPTRHQVLNARLGNNVRLLGYNLQPTPVSPGEALELTLYWQALATASESFKVFNHLIDNNHQLYAQQDGIPAQGNLPTFSWIPDEIIRDSYIIQIPADIPGGTYRLLTGMYRETDFSRLPVLGEDGAVRGDAILLTEVMIVSGIQ